MKYILLAKAVINKVLDKAVGPLEMAILGIVVISTLSYALAWQAPGGNPPVGNTDSPLNTGSTGQAKSGGLILNTGGAATGLIVQNGNVGIGTTSPDYKMSFGPDQGGVSNVLAFVDEASPNNAMRGIGGYNSGGIYGLAFWASLGDAATVSNTRMLIDANTGYVGIGTTSPTAKLAIELPYDGRLWDRNAYEPIMKLAAWQDGINNNGRGGAIDFYVNNQTSYYPSSRIIHTMSSGTGGELSFATTDNYTTTLPTRRLVIKGNGNVGIGTTTPTRKLDVSGRLLVREGAFPNDWDTADWGATVSFRRPGAANMASANHGNSQLEIASSGRDVPNIAFHAPGYYGANFGLDTDNWFSTQGWSAGGGYTSMKVGNLTANGSIRATGGTPIYHCPVFNEGCPGTCGNNLSLSATCVRGSSSDAFCRAWGGATEACTLVGRLVAP